jgi:cell wall-associated NlpC family hydrolase
VAALPAFADPSVSAKRAQAQQVVAQLQQLDGSMEQAIAQYQYATIKLNRIQHELRVNRQELQIAKKNYRLSERLIARRLVTLYTSDQSSTLEVILGAKSLDEMIARIDTEKSVSNLDATVLKLVKQSRATVRRSGRQLANARAAQTRLVSERAAKKREIENKIAEQNRLLSSIKGQIAQIQAAEQARQLQMIRQAQARLAQEHQQQAAAQDSTIVGITASAPGLSTVVAPPSQYSGVVGVAMSQLGTNYVWGGGSPGGFDCSGLVMWAYAQVGVSLPHSSYAQYGYGVAVSQDQLQPGDLVFFDGLGHVGIYIGGDQFIEAPHTGAFVQISSLSGRMGDYVGARRIL